MMSSVVWVKYRFDPVKMELDQGIESLRRCRRLRLGMSREEALMLMGAPLKEYDVRPTGKGSGVLFKELLFKMPLAKQPAYIDLDVEGQRVVEIYCNEHAHVAMALSGLAQEKLQPLPSDSAIPLTRH